MHCYKARLDIRLSQGGKTSVHNLTREDFYEGVDFVLAIGDADTAGFARELARRMAALDAGEDGFVPYGCILSEGKAPAVVGTGEVPVFAIIAPELLEGIGSPLRELLGSVCAAV